MKFIVISDTHGQHLSLNLPVGDVIIHAGDVSRKGEIAEVNEFLNWFSSLDFKYKIFIAGNHDFLFEKANPDDINELIPANVIYLNDSGIEIKGVKIWGSPVTPWFYDWAFNRGRGADIKKHWDLIPEDIEVLITHGPPHEILDETVYRKKVGCVDLANRVGKIQPVYHIFGHIHEGYGMQKLGKTTYINASVLDDHYDLINPPIVFSYSSQKNERLEVKSQEQKDLEKNEKGFF